MLTPEEMKELREAYAESTPGEWDYQPADCDCDDMEAKETDPKHQCGPTDLSLPEVQTAFGYTRRPSLFQVDCGDFMGLKNEDARFIALSHNAMPALLSAAEENAALKQQLSASEWIRKDNALRTYDGLTEQLEDVQKESAALQDKLSMAVSEIEELKKCPNEEWECTREIKRLTRELAESRARVAELEEALGACFEVANLFSVKADAWAIFNIVREALPHTPGDALTRLQALEKVAEAARKMKDWAGFDGSPVEYDFRPPCQRCAGDCGFVSKFPLGPEWEFAGNLGWVKECPECKGSGKGAYESVLLDSEKGER